MRLNESEPLKPTVDESNAENQQLSLEKLFEGVTPALVAPTEEEREWIDAKPMGKERF